MHLSRDWACTDHMAIEDNRMGKTRDIFKKIGDIKGTYHARMGIIKVRNNKILTGRRD